MRFRTSLALVIALGACRSEPQAPEAAASQSATPTAAATQPVPATTASDPDPTKAAALWLDRQTEPRQPGRYAPRDVCGDLPGARAFREKLAAAVLARDPDAIAAMASEDVRLGFGGDDGRKRLLERLRARDGKLLAELTALLPLGCAATDGGGLTIPWQFAQDLGDVDSYAAMIVTGVDVPLRAAASADATEKRRLSWDVVTLDKGLEPGSAFQRVTAPGGAKGFVATDRLRSVLDYRLLATRQGREWKITALLAGD